MFALVNKRTGKVDHVSPTQYQITDNFLWVDCGETNVFGFLYFNNQFLEPKKTISAYTNPSSSDDISIAVDIGTIWTNLETAVKYECKSNSHGSAIWHNYELPIQDQDPSNIYLSGGEIEKTKISPSFFDGKMTGNKTLTDESEQYQFLDPDGQDREVVISCSTGKLFLIQNTGSGGRVITIKDNNNNILFRDMGNGSMASFLKTGSSRFRII